MTAVQGRWVLGGGIASGKSLVRRLFEKHGVPTVDADSIGHSVLEPDGPAFGEVVAHWPDVVEEGRISRQLLAEIVFENPAELKALESITHPHIFGMITARVEEVGSGLVVEMPLNGEKLGQDWRQIVVDAPDEVRVGRAVDRGMEEEDVRARMSAQPPRAGWLARADVVIPNHGSLSQLEDAVAALVPHL